MHRLGLLLLWFGAIVGGLVAIGVGVNQIAPIALHGLSWWMALGLVKLTLLGSAGLMSAGAVMLRLANRERTRLLRESEGDSDSRLSDGS